MPNHYSAVYHVGLPDHVSPDRLVYVDDRDGAWADIYFHPLHVRQDLVWEVNWLSGHQIGSGLWRQQWTHAGRLQEPAEGLAVAASRWEIVPHAEMPAGRHAFPVEQDGCLVWLIRRGSCTARLCAEMNERLERIVGDGLWVQCWYRRDEGRASITSPAPMTSPAVVTPAV